MFLLAFKTLWTNIQTERLDGGGVGVRVEQMSGLTVVISFTTGTCERPKNIIKRGFQNISKTNEKLSKHGTRNQGDSARGLKVRSGVVSISVLSYFNYYYFFFWNGTFNMPKNGNQKIAIEGKTYKNRKQYWRQMKSYTELRVLIWFAPNS